RRRHASRRRDARDRRVCEGAQGAVRDRAVLLGRRDLVQRVDEDVASARGGGGVREGGGGEIGDAGTSEGASRNPGKLIGTDQGQVTSGRARAREKGRGVREQGTRAKGPLALIP